MEAHAKPALLRVREACHELGIGPSSFYELKRTGRIRTVTVGVRGVRVPASEIERIAREGFVPPTPSDGLASVGRL